MEKSHFLFLQKEILMLSIIAYCGLILYTDKRFVPGQVSGRAGG